MAASIRVSLLQEAAFSRLVNSQKIKASISLLPAIIAASYSLSHSISFSENIDQGTGFLFIEKTDKPRYFSIENSFNKWK
jgi:hypothetical protein